MDIERKVAELLEHLDRAAEAHDSMANTSISGVMHAATDKATEAWGAWCAGDVRKFDAMIDAVKQIADDMEKRNDWVQEHLQG